MRRTSVGRVRSASNGPQGTTLMAHTARGGTAVTNNHVDD